MQTQLWAIILTLISCVIGAFGPIYFKKASKDFSLNIIKIIKNKNLITGAFCYGMGSILFIPALKGGDLSVLYPLLAISYALVCLYSIKMLKEKMNLIKWLGIILIIVGVAFIGIGTL